LRARPRIKQKNRGLFISIRSERLLDKDNLKGGSKPIRDALKELGYIWDDSPYWYQYYCFQIKKPKGYRGPPTIITLEKCDDISEQPVQNFILDLFGLQENLGQLFK